jgi:signal transduction histidine kinase
MTARSPQSLRWLLVRRLVSLQAAILVSFLLLVVAALWGGGYLISPDPDDGQIELLRDAITRDATGRLSLRETPQLAGLRRQTPGFWFVIRDKTNQSISHGAVPPEFAAIGDALDGIGQARLGWNIGDAPRPTARVKWIDTDAGHVQIMTGSAGPMSWRRIALAISSLFVSAVAPAVAMMALATLIATPIVVRQALRGLDRAASHAAQVDIDKRGTQLPLDEVPVEIMPLVAAVNDALRRLDEGYEKHRRFLIDAAHELRTPIAILQTRLESLGLESLGRESGANRVLVDVARLSNLAEQLLDLQRIDRRMREFRPVNIVAMARKTVADLAPLAIATGYELSFEARPDRIDVSGDEGSLERALANLVQNSIEHGGRKGSITVRVGRPATISVSDEGPGVPPSQRERVFEPFYRLQGSDRGAGLGLNLVREIVRLHGGQVTMHDSAAGGACVTMTLQPDPPRPAAGAMIA